MRERFSISASQTATSIEATTAMPRSLLSESTRYPIRQRVIWEWLKSWGKGGGSSEPEPELPKFKLPEERYRDDGRFGQYEGYRRPISEGRRPDKGLHQTREKGREKDRDRNRDREIEEIDIDLSPLEDLLRSADQHIGTTFDVHPRGFGGEHQLGGSHQIGGHQETGGHHSGLGGHHGGGHHGVGHGETGGGHGHGGGIGGGGESGGGGDGGGGGGC